MSFPLVSIVLCSYNGEKYLREQLDSLLNQTYSPLEIIIRDDCSTDETYNILLEYQQKKQHIQVHQNIKNIGFNGNFETAVLQSKGDFIAICDQDDIWLPEKIEKLVNSIGENWLIFSNSELIDEEGTSLNKRLIRPLNIVNLDYRAIVLENFVSGHTTLFRKEFLMYILPFPTTGYYDWWMGFVALYHKKLIYLDLVLTKYRIHAASVINAQLNGASEQQIKNINHQSLLIQLSHFTSYLKNEKDNLIIDHINNIYRKAGGYNTGWSILFMHISYNSFFPFEKRRKLWSTTRYKFVANFIQNLSANKAAAHLNINE